ncbi:Galactitol permease IIC component [compost metagenome]
MDQGGSPITWLLIQLLTWQNVVGFCVIGAIYFTGVLLTWRRARNFVAQEKAQLAASQPVNSAS